MGDAFKKTSPGQKLQLPAAAYNAFIDTALAFQRGRLQRGAAGPVAAPLPEGLARVKNASGASQGRFGVLGIGGVAYGPGDNLAEFQNHVTFEAVAPAEPHRDRFVVLWEPLAPGKIGQAFVAGVCPVRVDILDDAHRFAQAIPGDAGKLRSSASGSTQILWAEAAGSNPRWAVVRLGGGGGSEPAGQYLGMVHSVVAQNTGGWDFIRYTVPLG